MSNNQGGVIPIYSPNVKLNEYKQCGKVTLLFIVDDLGDWYGHQCSYSAKLLKDGTGIVVKKPLVPNVFCTKANEIYNQRIIDGNADEQDQDANNIVITRLEENPESNVGIFIYKAPDGMQSSNAKFNNNAKGDTLVLEPIMDGIRSRKIKGIQKMVTYVFYQVLIKGSIKKIRGQDTSKADDPLVARFQGMALGAMSNEEEED